MVFLKKKRYSLTSVIPMSIKKRKTLMGYFCKVSLNGKFDLWYYICINKHTNNNIYLVMSIISFYKLKI